MRVRYVGSKAVKRDTVNDPPTNFVWSADNQYVVDIDDPAVAERFLRYDSIWQTVDETGLEAGLEAGPAIPSEAPKGRKGQV